MPKKTWQGEDHVLPRSLQNKTLGRVYDDTTIHRSHRGHVQRHRDIKEHTVAGSLALDDLRRWSKGRKSSLGPGT